MAHAGSDGPRMLPETTAGSPPLESEDIGRRRNRRCDRACDGVPGSRTARAGAPYCTAPCGQGFLAEGVAVKPLAGIGFARGRGPVPQSIRQQSCARDSVQTPAVQRRLPDRVRDRVHADLALSFFSRLNHAASFRRCPITRRSLRFEPGTPSPDSHAAVSPTSAAMPDDRRPRCR